MLSLLPEFPNLTIKSLHNYSHNSNCIFDYFYSAIALNNNKCTYSHNSNYIFDCFCSTKVLNNRKSVHIHTTPIIYLIVSTAQ